MGNSIDFLYDTSFDDYHTRDGFKLPYIKNYPKFDTTSNNINAVNYVHIQNNIHVKSNQSIILQANRHNYTLQQNDIVLICTKQPNINKIYIVYNFFTIPPNRNYPGYTKIALLKLHNIVDIKLGARIYDKNTRSTLKYISNAKGWIFI